LRERVMKTKTKEMATYVKSLRAQDTADARVKAKAIRQAADRVLLARAAKAAEADSNTRMIQRRAMGAAAFYEKHPMVVNISIDGVVGASVTLGQQDIVGRQSAEHALGMIVRQFTQFRQAAAAQAGIRASGHKPMVEVDVDGLLVMLRDQCRMAKGSVEFEKMTPR